MDSTEECRGLWADTIDSALLGAEACLYNEHLQFISTKYKVLQNVIHNIQHKLCNYQACMIDSGSFKDLFCEFWLLF